MRTKKEILEAIKQARERRDSYASTKQKAYTDIINGQIRALRWALGYKTSEWYWCIVCQKQHKGLRCPSCGNEAMLNG